MSYVQLYYHLVWATRRRQPMLIGSTETAAHGLIRAKAIQLGARVYGVNGMPDHVHLVVTIPPAVSVSEFVRQVKGASAKLLNEEQGGDFAWQAKYGAFSFAQRSLPTLVEYVQNQKEHHRANQLIAAWEDYPAPNPSRLPAGAPS